MDKVICIGKNYLEHALELSKMIGDSIPSKPVIFFKPPSTIQQTAQNGLIEASLPTNRGEAHHELEIVLRISKDLKSFDAVTLGLDMTLRDTQGSQKEWPPLGAC